MFTAGAVLRKKTLVAHPRHWSISTDLAASCSGNRGVADLQKTPSSVIAVLLYVPRSLGHRESMRLARFPPSEARTLRQSSVILPGRLEL